MWLILLLGPKIPDAKYLISDGGRVPGVPSALPPSGSPSTPLPPPPWMVPRPGPLPATSDTRAAFFPGHLGPGALLSGRALLNKNLPPSTPPSPLPPLFP